MSRETKFRAWHRKTKTWACVLELYYTTHGDQFGAVLFGKDVPRNSYGCHEYDLVEYTGLKDKNGVEIYFEDIIYNGWFINARQVVGEHFVAKMLMDIDKMNNPMEHIEVIGNIYENQDLLKGDAK